MTKKYYAEIEKDGTVSAIRKYEEGRQPEDSVEVKEQDNAAVGGKYENGIFIPPVTEQKETEEEKLAGVKQEAYSRIISLCPEWKQRNLTAQAVLLVQKGKDHWSEKEEEAWKSGEEIWKKIREIREASDKLEENETIPEDYRDDKHWP